MAEWTEHKLKELTVKIGSGATPSGGGNNYKSEGISLIRSQNVLDFKFSYDGLAFIDEEQADGLKNVIVQENDILLNITGDSVARACKVASNVLPARVNQHVSIVRPDKAKLDSDFLLYYLQSIKEYLLVVAEIGATRNALTKGMIENLDFTIPKLPEQQAIAEVLSSLDDKIDLLHRQNKTLEALAETLFRQWFVEEAEESWEEVRVRDVCKTITKGTTPTTLGNGFTETGINFLKAESLTDEGDLIESKFSFIDEATHQKLSRSKIEANDLIITIAGTIGRVAIIPQRVVPANTNQAVAILRVAENTVSPVFLYCLFKSTEIRNDFESRVVHAVQPNLSLGEIGDMAFKLPPSEKLKTGERQLELVLQKKENNNIQIRTLTQIRDTLLPKLMSGEVRVELSKTESAMANQ